jgi:predicted O-methyltransferase YrrM
VARAGLGDVVDVRTGPALETLPALAAAGAGPFDLIFIDADKASTTEYFEWALKLSRPGSVIVIDNVVRHGGLVDPNGDADAQGMRRAMERLKVEKRVTATGLQTVGTKGYDGFAIAIVEG